MSRLPAALFMICLPFATSAADQGRFSYLEQEVRNLQRQVTTLNRRLDEVTRPNRAAAPASLPREPAAAVSTSWVDADKWRKVEAGMSELEVVSLLGAPTSMRDVDGARVLFYAMELGTSGFLGGSVKFRDRAVSEVQTPILQ